jgi:hypothetical protein
MNQYIPQAPHPISEKGRQFLASLSPREAALQTMMSKSLGSSYFVERTHAFRKWLAAQEKPSEKSRL